MIKSIEEISETKKRLTLEIPADAIESKIKESLLDVQKKSRIAGFRPGKAPLSLIEKKYGKSIESEVLEKLISEYYHKAIQDSKLKPITQPIIEHASEFLRNTPLSLTFLIEVLPQIENLVYDGIKVKDIPIEVTEKEIERVIKNLAEEKAIYENVEGFTELGDLITVDFKTDIEENPTKDFVIRIGISPFPKEFHEALINKRVNEQFEFSVSFPSEMQSLYAGKTINFNMTIKDIKRKKIPSIDDEFAKDLGFDSLDKIREEVKESLTKVKSRYAKNRMCAEIIDKLLETYKFEVPESMLNAKVEDMIAEKRTLSNDDRSDEELRKELLPIAEKEVKTFILLKFIGEKENINVTEEEMKTKIIEIALNNQLKPDEVIKHYLRVDGSLTALNYSIYEQKVKDLLLNKSEVIKGEEL